MVSVKHIDANTVESTQKKGSQVTMTVVTKVSKDGNSRTSTFKGKDAEGHELNNVVVFDRQWKDRLPRPTGTRRNVALQ